jgi:hypothetical protein
MGARTTGEQRKGLHLTIGNGSVSGPATIASRSGTRMRQNDDVFSVRPVRPKGGPVNLVVYAALAFVPAGFFLALAKLLDRWARGGGRERAEAVPVGPPIERLVHDLRRLQRDYTRIERSDLPRRDVRLQGVSLAYDDTLCACCTALQIPVPGRPPLGGFQRLEIEATLAQYGLIW